MICVFAAFMAGDLRVLRVIGLGMAAAIFLDATLVRMVAMPAALRLLGRASWRFPHWLDGHIVANLKPGTGSHEKWYFFRPAAPCHPRADNPTDKK